MKHSVIMLKTLPGVHDGEIYPVTFLEGHPYEIGPDLLQAFVNAGAVKLAEGEAPDAEAKASEPEEKSEGNAPANKMRKAAPENKSK